ncbi:MAG: DNA-formamidopyrimidine glycosylase family protein [Anaerolineales bacterium]
MPELPELEHARRQLEDLLTGRRIARIELDPKGSPLVLRDQLGKGLDVCVDAEIEDVQRRGKFLIFALSGSPSWLVVNPKLTGRLQLCQDDTPRLRSTWLVFQFHRTRLQLRYADVKRMGQLYLADNLDNIPNFGDMGPDALAIGRAEFHARIRRYRGEIKGILSREAFIAGVGNAYADEILWQASLHPYRKRTTLASAEIDRLFEAVRITLFEACHLVRQSNDTDIHLKPRSFFHVHQQGGQPCPRCGTTISEIRARQRLTNFCRTCQPGGLFNGMGAATVE